MSDEEMRLGYESRIKELERSLEREEDAVRGCQAEIGRLRAVVCEKHDAIVKLEKDIAFYEGAAERSELEIQEALDEIKSLKGDFNRDVFVMAGNGRFYNPFDLTCEDFSDLEPIAIALSRIHRFWGQTALTVAQHCVDMAMRLEKQGEPIETVLWGLLHEVSEAFLGDLPTPIKVAFPAYRKLEHEILRRMADCLQLPFPMPSVVKRLDRQMMVEEAVALMPESGYWRHFAEEEGIELPDELPAIVAKASVVARRDFLATAKRLLAKRKRAACKAE